MLGRLLGHMMAISLTWAACCDVALADCADLVSRFNDAASKADLDGAAAIYDREISVAGDCDTQVINVTRDRVAGLFLAKARQIQTSSGQVQRYEELIRRAAGFRAPSWEIWRRLGDIQTMHREYKDAANTYQEAIEALPESDPAVTQEVRRYLALRADEARHLAASASGVDGRGEFVPALVNRAGRLSGVYSSAVDRGLEGTRIPAPIMFRFDSTEFTPAGTEAAAELAEFLRERQATHVVVIGHTDQKGSDEYNLALSRRRADAVIAFLSKSGIRAQFRSIGKGKSEPRAISSDANYTQDEINQLNRRVEVSSE